MTTPAQLTQERNSTHGDWDIQSVNAQELKATLQDCCVRSGKVLPPHQREALEMIMVKVSRIVSGDNLAEEHWDDIEGYSYLGKHHHNKLAAEMAAKLVPKPDAKGTYAPRDKTDDWESRVDAKRVKTEAKK